MKILPEHYAHMHQAIQAKGFNFRAMRHNIQIDGRVKDIEKRLRWNCLWHTGLSQWVCETLYSYCNDDHIDTALRAIMKELQGK